MDILKIRRYLCITCKKANIFERITEHIMEGNVPDISNCDFSSYSGHTVIGGRLLSNRPSVGWEILSYYLVENKTINRESRPGGVCDTCLKEGSIAALADGGHIRFATEKDLRQRRR